MVMLGSMELIMEQKVTLPPMKSLTTNYCAIHLASNYVCSCNISFNSSYIFKNHLNFVCLT